MLSRGTVMLNMPTLNPNPIENLQNTTNPLEAKMDSAVLFCICKVLDRIDLPTNQKIVGSQHKEERNLPLEHVDWEERSDSFLPAFSLCCCSKKRYEGTNGSWECRRSTRDNSGRFLEAAKAYRTQFDPLFPERNTAIKPIDRVYLIQRLDKTLHFL